MEIDVTEKPRRSGPNTDACVTVTLRDNEVIEVGSTRMPGTLRFDREEWDAFTGSVRDGQFDI